MADWRSRLAVSVNGNVITPIDSFTPTINLATEVLHSLEATHVGFVENPASFTFSMTVRAIGTAAAELTRLALNGTEFQIILQATSESPPDQWSFVQLLFNRCIITSANPSNATISGAPAATFSGVCLEHSAVDGSGTVTVP